MKLKYDLLVHLNFSSLLVSFMNSILNSLYFNINEVRESKIFISISQMFSFANFHKIEM